MSMSKNADVKKIFKLSDQPISCYNKSPVTRKMLFVLSDTLILIERTNMPNRMGAVILGCRVDFD